MPVMQETVCLDSEIAEGHLGCSCPLCNEAIKDWEEHAVVVAHGFCYLVHSSCLGKVISLTTQQSWDVEDI